MFALSNAELLELLRVAKAAKPRGHRDWLLFLVTFWHGLRVSEAVGFTRDAVKDGHLTIARLKGSNRTTQALVTHENPLLDERDALVEYVRKSSPFKPVFDISRHQFWVLMRRHGAIAGLPAHKCHPHILKHSVAMQSIHSAGIENVRQHLGHKSIASTGIYLKVSDAEAGAAVTRALQGPHKV